MGEPHEVIDLVSGAPGASGQQARSRAVLVALAVVAALAAATLLLVPDGDAEVAVEETTTTSTPDAPDGDAGTFPAPLALGAPHDGKDSVGLPVKAEPATGLVDGQTVRVTGTGFPPGESVGVVMCAKEAGRDHGGRGAEACNLGRFAQVSASSDGVASVDFEVRRLVSLDRQEIDCASEAQRCLIGMGLISDYDQSGGVLVDFDGSVPLPDPPSVSLDREGPFDDGDRVTLRVDGLLPGTAASAIICTVDGEHCPASTAHAEVGDDGTASIDVRLWRAFAAPVWESPAAPSDVDCAVVACHLQVWGEAVGDRMIPTTPLAFTSGALTRARPEVEERSEGPYRPGDEVTIFVGDVPFHTGIEVAICNPEWCADMQVTIEWVDGGVESRFPIPTAAQGSPCDGGECRIRVRLHGTGDGDEAPPLAPEPVEVVVEA